MRGFFPLDDRLALGLHRVSPHVVDWIVQVGTVLPFRRAARLLASLTGVQVSASLVRRVTEAVGATAVAQGDAEVAHLMQTLADPPVGPPRLVIGADGAMVPLLKGEWAEVKLVSIGVPTTTGQVQDLSYFARLADASTFTDQALGELHRRGVESAQQVAAVQDGALWLQGFVDLHRPDALRILDWPHACEHLTALVAQLFGQDTVRTKRTAARLQRWLWEEGPDRVLPVLQAWLRVRPVLATAVAYFQQRRAHLDYPRFRAAGWPVGSGATESGHKQVMQARMKGAGMHWQRAHVNPLLALSLLAHNGRWEPESPALLQHYRTVCRQTQRSRGQARRTAARVCPVIDPPPSQPSPHPWRHYGVPLSPKL